MNFQTMYGGLVLFILFVFITASVFIIKFVLDYALNKKIADLEKGAEKNIKGKTKERPVKGGYVYAVKTEKKRKGKSSPEYTVIPKDKLYIMENPDKYEETT